MSAAATRPLLPPGRRAPTQAVPRPATRRTAPSRIRLLKDGGKLSLCHRPERLAEVLAVLRAHRLEPKRLAFVKNKPDAAPWLFLVEAQKNRRTGLRIEPDVLITAGAAMYGEVK